MGNFFEILLLCFCVFLVFFVSFVFFEWKHLSELNYTNEVESCWIYIHDAGGGIRVPVHVNHCDNMSFPYACAYSKVFQRYGCIWNSEGNFCECDLTRGSLNLTGAGSNVSVINSF